MRFGSRFSDKDYSEAGIGDAEWVGWPVYAPTKEAALAKFREREKFQKELARASSMASQS